MPWFKVDDKITDHPKTLRAGNACFGAWVRAGAWSCNHLTDGFIPFERAHTIASKKTWEKLIEVRFAEPADGGYQIHDFLDWNPSGEAVRAERESRSEIKRQAGRKGGVRSGESRRKRADEGAVDASHNEAETKQNRSRTEATEEAEPKQEPKHDACENAKQEPKQNEAPYPYPYPIPEEDLNWEGDPDPVTPSPPASQNPPPPQVDRSDMHPTAVRFLDVLLECDSLHLLATPQFAELVAQKSKDLGGRHCTADLIHALRVVAEREEGAMAIGEAPPLKRALSNSVLAFLDKTRPGEGRRDQARQDAAAAMLEVYAERWRKVYRRLRVPDENDVEICLGLLVVAEDYSPKFSMPPGEIMLSWFDQYLERDDKFLVDHCHKLRLLPGMVSEFDLRPRRKPQAVQEAPEQEVGRLSNEETAQYAAVAMAALKMPGFAPAPRHTEPTRAPLRLIKSEPEDSSA